MNKFARKVLGVPVRYRIRVHRPENLPPHQAYIIVTNHQSNLDSNAIWLTVADHSQRMVYQLAMYQLKKYFGRFGHWLGMIYIDPKDKASILEAARRQLANGDCIGIFPESTRNPSPDTLLKAKTGAARLALTTNVPIVPAGIIAPQGTKWYQGIINYFFTRKEYSITIGRPLHFKQYNQADITRPLLEKTSRKIMLAIGELCNKRYPY